MEQKRALVMKFGGTSVKDANAVRRLAQIVARGHQPRAVVVSALAGVTDTLCALTDGAVRANAVPHTIAALAARHGALLDELGADRGGSGAARVAGLWNAIRSIVSIGERCSAADRDRVLAAGELASSIIVTEALRAAGLPAFWVDARRVIVTDDRFGMARPLSAAIRDAARRRVVPVLDNHAIPVLGGFIGSTADGATTTLGRGGSDYSAALLAAAIDAGELQIWTDVDGVRTADPRIVSGAQRIDHLSFAEAYELARFGAKVLHWGTLEPVATSGIRLRVLDASHPARPGTLVTAATSGASARIAGLAQQQKVTVADVRPCGVVGSHRFFSTARRWLHRDGRGHTVITLSPGRALVASADAAAVEAFVAAIAEVGDVQRSRDVALTTIVGHNVSSHPAAWRALSAAAQARRVVSCAATQSGHAMVAIGGDAPALLADLHDALLTRNGEEAARHTSGGLA